MRNISVETLAGLFVDISSDHVSLVTLVHRVIVHSEGTLGSHELWDRSMVGCRNLLAVESVRYDLFHLCSISLGTRFETS